MMRMIPFFALIVATFVSSTPMHMQLLRGNDVPAMCFELNGYGNEGATYSNGNVTNLDMVVLVGIQMNLNGTTNRTIIVSTNVTASVQSNRADMDYLNKTLQNFKQQVRAFQFGVNGTNNFTCSDYNDTNTSRIDTIIIMAYQMNGSTNRSIVLARNITTNVNGGGTNLTSLDNAMVTFQDQLACFHMGGNWSANGATNCSFSTYNTTCLDTVVTLMFHMNENGTKNTTIFSTTNITSTGDNRTDTELLNETLHVFKEQIRYLQVVGNGNTNCTFRLHNKSNEYPLDMAMIAGVQINANRTANKSIIVTTNVTSGNQSDTSMDRLDNLLENFKNHLECFQMENRSYIRANNCNCSIQNCPCLEHLNTVLQALDQLITRLETVANGTNDVTSSNDNVARLNRVLEALRHFSMSLREGVSGITNRGNFLASDKIRLRRYKRCYNWTKRRRPFRRTNAEDVKSYHH